MQYLQQPPQQGRVGGTELVLPRDFEIDIRDRLQAESPPADMNNVSQAWNDLKMIRQYCKKAKKRKATPDWSATLEAWHLILMPLDRQSRQGGIGYSDTPENWRNVQKR